MSTWEQAMKVARAKAFATKMRWRVIGHRGTGGTWCWHAMLPGFMNDQYRAIPPRERA